MAPTLKTELKGHTAKLANQLDGLVNDVHRYVTEGDPEMASSLLTDEAAPILAKLSTNDSSTAAIYRDHFLKEFSSSENGSSYCLPTGLSLPKAFDVAIEKHKDEPKKSHSVSIQPDGHQSSSASVARLPDYPWPEPLNSAAFQGIAGEFIHLLEPETEADPAALLLCFLAGIGNVVGTGAYHRIAGTDHIARLFIVMVGESSKARKDTTWCEIRNVLERVDPTWAERLQPGGAAVSGEGIIHAVRDPITIGEGDSFEVTDPGVLDKRLFLIESEFSSMLSKMNRPGNSLSGVFRMGWDGGRLQSLTKNSPCVATGAQLGIVGLTTKKELRRNLSGVDAASGFGNRFLFCCAKRSKLLPFGGDPNPADYNRIVEHLQKCHEWAQTAGALQWSDDAADAWESVYGDLSRERPGLVGAVCSRAETQTLRLMIHFAILDRSKEFKLEHLQAALAVWEFCESSARYIFGNAVGVALAEEIAEAFERSQTTSMTRTQINNLFSRNKEASEIELALAALIKNKTIWLEKKETGKRGRPAEIYHLCKGVKPEPEVE